MLKRARKHTPRRPRRHSPPRKKSPAAPVAPPPAAPAPEPAGPGKRGYVFGNVTALMRAIFRENNPVDLATDLMKDSNDTTKAKVFLQCLEYLYGKPVQPVETRSVEDNTAPFEFFTHIPPKNHPSHPSRGTSSSGIPAGRPSPGGRADESEILEEDQNE